MRGALQDKQPRTRHRRICHGSFLGWASDALTGQRANENWMQLQPAKKRVRRFAFMQTRLGTCAEAIYQFIHRLLYTSIVFVEDWPARVIRAGKGVPRSRVGYRKTSAPSNHVGNPAGNTAVRGIVTLRRTLACRRILQPVGQRLRNHTSGKSRSEETAGVLLQSMNDGTPRWR